MYHVVSIGKLSETQKSRLRNGHATRIKKGNGNKLHLTAEQIKKLESAHKKGRGLNLTMYPEQAEKHGAGLFGDIATKVKKLANKHKDLINPIIKAVKNAGHRGLQKASTSLHNKINEIPELSGEGVKRRRGRPKKGAGVLGDIIGMINPTMGAVAKTVGLGAKKTRKPRTKKGKGVMSTVLKGVLPSIKMGNGKGKRGKGVLTDIAKAGAKKLAPIIIDAAAGAAKGKIAGMGAKKRRVGRPRKNGGALYPA